MLDQITRFLSGADYASRDVRWLAKAAARMVGTDDGVVACFRQHYRGNAPPESEIIAWHFGRCAKRRAGRQSSHGFAPIFALCEALCEALREALRKRELLKPKHHLNHAHSGADIPAKQSGFAGLQRLSVSPR